MKITSFEILEDFSLQKYISSEFRSGLNIMIPDNDAWNEILDNGFKLLGRDYPVSTFRDVLSYKFQLEGQDCLEFTGHRGGGFLHKFYPSPKQGDRAVIMSKLAEGRTTDEEVSRPSPVICEETDLDAFEVFRYTSGAEPYTLSSKEGEDIVRLAYNDESDMSFMNSDDHELWSWLCGVAMGVRRGMCVVVDHTLSDLFCKKTMDIRFFTALDDFCQERGFQMIALTRNGMMRPRYELKKYIVRLDKAV